jgi:uncharacterized protein (TIGR02646 family)
VKSLVDAPAFAQRARAFERLALNGERRRAGFRAYGGEVLVDGDFPAVWRHDALRAALGAMSGGHCAYCQACVEDNSYGPVDHFRPKALFPTLAFVVLNYFFGCQRCNLAKSDKWPESGSYVRPDEGDPRVRLVFDERGRVSAAPGDAEAEATIRDFKLNRPGLQKQRRVAIRERLRDLRGILNMPGLTDGQRVELARQRLVRRLTRFSEAINQNVRRAWGRAYPGVTL